METPKITDVKVEIWCALSVRKILTEPDFFFSSEETNSDTPILGIN